MTKKHTQGVSGTVSRVNWKWRGVYKVSLYVMKKLLREFPVRPRGVERALEFPRSRAVERKRIYEL